MFCFVYVIELAHLFVMYCTRRRRVYQTKVWPRSYKNQQLQAVDFVTYDCVRLIIKFMLECQVYVCLMFFLFIFASSKVIIQMCCLNKSTSARKNLPPVL